MHKGNVNSVYLNSSVFILVFSCFIQLFSGCRNSSKLQEDNQERDDANQVTGSDGYPVYVKFRSFQNPDSTWGFTIFVTSKPFLHYKKIPVDNSVTGFESQKDADAVANLFVNMIRQGDLTPELSKKAIDSLGLKIRNKNMQD